MSSIEVCEGTHGHHLRYRGVGSYRGAAEHVGTTHKTVERAIDKFEAEQAGSTTSAGRV
ncbi:MAG: hypothetical protein ACOH2Q_22475 [Rhodococcus sp. (in: high G+C Gram-positive bacteria)]